MHFRALLLCLLLVVGPYLAVVVSDPGRHWSIAADAFECARRGPVVCGIAPDWVCVVRRTALSGVRHGASMVMSSFRWQSPRRYFGGTGRDPADDRGLVSTALGARA